MKTRRLTTAIAAACLGLAAGGAIAVTTGSDSGVDLGSPTTSTATESTPTDDSSMSPTETPSTDPPTTTTTDEAPGGAEIEADDVDKTPDNPDAGAIAAEMAGIFAALEPAPFIGYEPPTVASSATAVTVSGDVQFRHELDEALAIADAAGVEFVNEATVLSVEDSFAGRYVGILIANGWAFETDQSSGFGGRASSPSRVRCLIVLGDTSWRVPCALPHNAAIEQTLVANDGTHPGDNALVTRAWNECPASETDRVHVPSAQDFAAGLREIHCENRYTNGFFSLDGFGDFADETGEFAYTEWLRSNGFTSTTSLGSATSGTCVVRLSPTGLSTFFDLDANRRFNRVSSRLIVPCWMPHSAEAVGPALEHRAVDRTRDDDSINATADRMCRDTTPTGAGLGVVGSSADEADRRAGDLGVRCVVHEVTPWRWILASHAEALLRPDLNPVV